MKKADVVVFDLVAQQITDPMAGMMALYCVVIQQAQMDLTQGIRLGQLTRGLEPTRKLMLDDGRDPEAQCALRFLRSQEAQELCDVITAWAGGAVQISCDHLIRQAVAEADRESPWARNRGRNGKQAKDWTPEERREATLAYQRRYHAERRARLKQAMGEEVAA